MTDLPTNTSADQLETRHYIGLVGTGRMIAKVGPGTPESFKLGPTDPMPMLDGRFLYPVSAEVADEYMSDECDDCNEAGR